MFVFFFKQKTAYEMRISDWSSDVCSSDLRALADKIRLRLADRPGEAGIIRCDRPVRVLTDDDVALLRAEHMHGLGAVRRDAELAAGFVERLPEVKSVAGGHVDLVADLAGEADTEQPSRTEEHTSELQSLIRISYA